MKTINLILTFITAFLIISCDEESSIAVPENIPETKNSEQIKPLEVETIKEKIIDSDLPIIKAIGGEGKSKKVPLGKSADQPTTA